jgi:hypothetical protein
MSPPSKKKQPQNKQSAHIQTGDIHDISGRVNIAGGNIDIDETSTVHYSEEVDVILEVLAETFESIQKRPDTSSSQKGNLEAEIQEIEAEVKKKKSRKGYLAQRFNNIGRMAPDILDVILASLGNPVSGIGMTIKKIAEKAKIEAEKI